MVYETFDDKLKDNQRFKSVSGVPTLEIYEYRVSKDGYKELVKTDRKEDVHARIQADADSCDINKLMARFALGDSSAIDQRSGFYADVTKMPSTYAEMFDRVEVAKQYFDSLPVEVKQSFDNSYEVFFSQYGSKDFDDKIQKYNDSLVDHKYDSKHTEDTGTVIKENVPSNYVEVER